MSGSKKESDLKNTNQLYIENADTDEFKKRYPDWEKITANRSAKDSVFTDLFSDPQYLLELYKSLCPEDSTVRKEDFEIVSLENILLNGSYNDLGFLVRGRFLILVEAQSSWNPNIPMRMLDYVTHSFQEYRYRNKLNGYGSKLEKYPFPEFYVIYTGSTGVDEPRELHLKDAFMDFGRQVKLDLVVNLIDASNSSGILSEYICFCRIYTDMVKKHGYTVEAVKETIRICKNNNYLKDYLESREVEVTRMLSRVFDQQTAVVGMVRALEHERDTALHNFEMTQTQLDDTKTQLDDTKTQLDDSINKFIALCFDMKLNDKDIIDRISQVFSISEKDSKLRIQEYRNTNTSK